MCFSLALAPYSSLDRSNNGGHVLELPLEYDDYFRLFDNPLNHPLSSTRYSEGDGEEYVVLDPIFSGLVIRWGINLARKIAAASYGGRLPDGYSGFSLRPDSLQELGVILPPLLELFDLFAEEGHPLDRVLTVAEVEYWLHVFRDNAMRTRDWILDAERRSLLLGPYSHWDFNVVSCSIGAACQCYPPIDYDDDESVQSEHSRYSPSHPTLDLSHIPRSFNHSSSLRVETNGSNTLGLSLDGKPDNRSDSSLSYASMASSFDHPTCGRFLTSPIDALPEENACRALISHPVLGPGAQNALAHYRPPSTRTLGPSDPRSPAEFRSPPPSPTLSGHPSPDARPNDGGQHEPHGLGSDDYRTTRRLHDSLFRGDLNTIPVSSNDPDADSDRIVLTL